MVLIRSQFFTEFKKCQICQQNIARFYVHTLDLNRKLCHPTLKKSNYFFFFLLSAFVGKPLKHQIPLRQLPKTISGAQPLWRLCLQTAFYLQGLNKGVLESTPGESGSLFLLPMKEKLFILRTHQWNFSTTDKNLSLILTPTLVVECFLWETFWSFKNFLLVLIRQAVKVRALTWPGFILYSVGMVLFWKSAHTDVVYASIQR